MVADNTFDVGDEHLIHDLDRGSVKQDPAVC